MKQFQEVREERARRKISELLCDGKKLSRERKTKKNVSCASLRCCVSQRIHREREEERESKEGKKSWWLTGKYQILRETKWVKENRDWQWKNKQNLHGTHVKVFIYLQITTIWIIEHLWLWGGSRGVISKDLNSVLQSLVGLFGAGTPFHCNLCLERIVFLIRNKN